MFRTQDFKCLVDQFGREVSLISNTEGSYDPTTGTVTGGSSSTATIKAYFYNYSLGETNGSEILMGDRRVAMSPFDTSGAAVPEPEAGDRISGVGDDVGVVRVAQLYSGDTLICYLLQVRE